MYLHNSEDEADEALVDNSILPGVHTAEADDEIPGVDMCRKPPRYVPYKGTYVPYDGTFGASDQGQTIDV